MIPVHPTSSRQRSYGSQALAEKAHAGDARARDALILEAQSGVAYHVQRWVQSAGRPDLTEDLQQAGLLALLDALATFDPAQGAWWFYARYRVANAVRDALTALLSSGDELTEELEPPASGPEALTEDEIASKLDAHARRAVIKDTLGVCSPRQREVLERAALGASSKDIARELGMSPGQVRKYLQAARARGQALLGAARLS